MIALGGVLGCDGVPLELLPPATWTRHTIAANFDGADGVRLGDVNGDGRVDLVVGWEESGVVTVHLHPGSAAARGVWPQVIVGDVPSVEDAVFVDVDADGAFDVVSSSEAGSGALYVHWAPSDPADYTDASAWTTAPLPDSVGVQDWLFCAPLQVDGQGGIDLVAGGKGDGARLGWWRSPANPRDLSAWQWVPLAAVGWTMSILPGDYDGDGWFDVIYTDRTGEDRGTYLLTNPGNALLQQLPWPRRTLAADGPAPLFADRGDLDGDGALDVVVALDARTLVWYRPAPLGLPWTARAITLPDSFGTAKAVRLADLDGDGRLDIVFSGESAGGDRAGVGWARQVETALGTDWVVSALSDTTGSKFDLVQVFDVDGDGDNDVVTTEESAGLGVVWYENPAR